MNIKRLFLASLAGAVVAFICSNISWMAFDWHFKDFRSFADPAPVVESIKNQTQDNGVYMLPNIDMKDHGDPEKHEEWVAGAAKGPFAFMIIRPNGFKASMGAQMATMFLIQLITAFLITLLLTQTKIESLFNRAVFVSIVAVVGAMYSSLSGWNWWGFPTIMTIVTILDTEITWLIAGLAIGKIYKPS
jgi:hypothetical protein